MTNKNKYILISLLSLGLIGIDILTKILFEGKNYVLIKNFLTFESTHNYGAGLGILSGQTVLLIVLTFVFLGFFVFYDVYSKNKNKLYIIAFCFILSGAIGNLIDRIIFGYVRDFIHINISIMPYYFNFADIFLTVGVILFIIEILFKREHKKDDKELESK